jgi:RNA polymerase sigma factor (TIGR02999 family)
LNDITRILGAIEDGEPRAAGELLPVVYDELRRLAAQRMAQERAGHTLDATALVHEAYLRLVQSPGEADRPPSFANRRHFFAAAAEAMQRILVDQARRKHAVKRGGGQARQDVELTELPMPDRPEELVALDEALGKLAGVDAQAAELVRLRYFVGFSLLDAAEILQISPRTGHRLWAYARAFLHREVRPGEPGASASGG